MIFWLRIIGNVLTTAVIVFQLFVIRRMSRRNSELHGKLMDQIIDNMNLSHALHTERMERFHPTTTSAFSQATQQIMSKMPAGSYYINPTIRPPSGMNQPTLRTECVNCGRPILRGDPTDRWRDHAGRYGCDGAIGGTPLEHHVPRRERKPSNDD